QAQLLIEAGNAVLEAQRVDFYTIHEDDAHTGKRIVVKLADRLASQFLPREFLFFQGRAFVIEDTGNGIHGASISCVDLSIRVAARNGRRLKGTGSSHAEFSQPDRRAPKTAITDR